MDENNQGRNGKEMKREEKMLCSGDSKEKGQERPVLAQCCGTEKLKFTKYMEVFKRSQG